MEPPSETQQKAIAITPMPFAIIAFISSAYLIYYLLCRERERLERMYHRLILAMNFSLLLLSFGYIWGIFAIPSDAPNYYLNMGTIQSCTANGFIGITVAMTVPIYYGSLVLQAFMGMKNNFNENKYRWIEKWIHMIAWGFPLAVSTVLAATENINPSGSGCWYAKYPKGCDIDPNVDCERGQDIGMFTLIVGLTQVFLYFVYPPSVILAMHCWIRGVKRKKRECRGMHQVREAAKKEMLQGIAKQISLYLLAFWFTFVLGLIHNAYVLLSGGKLLYNLLIISNCVFAFQGFVFMIVYFKLEKMGMQKVDCEEAFASVTHRSTYNGGRPSDLTVMGIRSNVERKSQYPLEASACSSRRTSVFNIFDGIPDNDSPWAQFIDQDSDDSDSVADNEDMIIAKNEGRNMQNDKSCFRS